MHKPIPVISIDGGAKTSKSTVCTAVAEILSQKMRVKTADAGAFVRRNTAAVFYVLGKNDLSGLSDAEIDNAVDKAVADGTAFDDGFDWGDLERPDVSRWVSVIGKRPAVQEAKMKWYGILIEQTVGTADVLVINARNPRLHMRKWLDNGQARVVLELFTQCEPREAARRKLLGHGITDFTEQQLAEETQGVIDRRNLDLTRPTDTFIEPTNLLPYALGDDPQEVIQKMWTIDPAEAPLPISFDTTAMTKEQMIEAAQSLALAALDFDSKR